MKKKLLFGIVSSLLLATMIFVLAGCSSYSKVKSALESAGYEVKADINDSVLVKAIKEELKNADASLEVNAYAFAKKDAGITDLLKGGFIIEFKSSKELEKAIGDSETLKGIVKDIQKSDFVNKNCVCVSIDPDFSKAFKESK